MTFVEQLVKRADQVERFLQSALTDDGKRVPTRLGEAMRYAVLGAGKRIRPFLVVESALLFNVPISQALHAASAVELVHCYSLVHDDLPAMDDDDVRRGRATVHVAFDEATAILAGDALQALAFEVLSWPETHPEPSVRLELIAQLARAAGWRGMAAGQMLDLQAEEMASHDQEHVITLQRLKTGALFCYCLEVGAILGHGSPAERRALHCYGESIGLAFQIADDILDHTSSIEELGKQTQKDQAAGKATFVDLLGLAGARDKANELVEAACLALVPFGQRANWLRAAAKYIAERKT